MSPRRSDLKSLPDAYLKCRGGYNHAWEDCPPPIDHLEVRRGVAGWRMWLRCMRCEALRLDIVNRSSGLLEARSYWLPDGYSIEGERHPREHFRYEMIKRLKAKE